GTVVKVTAGGHTVTGTTGHMVPAKLTLTEGTWIVYLMYRADRGWRIGQTKSVRAFNNGSSRPELGFGMRVNQERADALWILNVCDSKAEATYWEARHAADYGLPTACFHGIGRTSAMDDHWLDVLFATLDTEPR